MIVSEGDNLVTLFWLQWMKKKTLIIFEADRYFTAE